MIFSTSHKIIYGYLYIDSIFHFPFSVVCVCVCGTPFILGTYKGLGRVYHPACFISLSLHFSKPAITNSRTFCRYVQPHRHLLEIPSSPINHIFLSTQASCFNSSTTPARNRGFRLTRNRSKSPIKPINPSHSQMCI